MALFTVIVKEAPYGRQTAYNALRFAHGLLGTGNEVNIFLMQDGVYLGKKGQAPEETFGQTFPNYLTWLGDTMEAGAKVYVCNRCAGARGLSPEDFIEGSIWATMDDLISSTTKSSQTTVW